MLNTKLCSSYIPNVYLISLQLTFILLTITIVPMFSTFWVVEWYNIKNMDLGFTPGFEVD